MKTVQVVLDSRNRDMLTFPSPTDFQLRLPEPIRFVKAIRVLQTELQDDTLTPFTPVYLTLNDWSHVLLPGQSDVAPLARIFPGRQVYPMLDSVLLDPYTYVLTVPQTLQHFQLRLHPSIGTTLDPTNVAIVLSIVYGWSEEQSPILAPTLL